MKKVNDPPQKPATPAPPPAVNHAGVDRRRNDMTGRKHKGTKY